MININVFTQGKYGSIFNLPKRFYKACAIVMTGVLAVGAINIASVAFAKNNDAIKEIYSYEDTQKVSQEATELTEFSQDAIMSEQIIANSGSTYDNNGNKTIVNKVGIKITKEEYDILLRIVEAESGNQDIKGRILVANVIFNRVKSERQPNTIKEVVYASTSGIYQFEPVQNGSINTVEVDNITKDAVSKALDGVDYSQGALYFCTSTTDHSWFDENLTFLFEHGSHYFYKI